MAILARHYASHTRKKLLASAKLGLFPSNPHFRAMSSIPFQRFRPEADLAVKAVLQACNL